MSNINIRALAKELGLSVGTVSKALRDSHEISAGTKQKVQDLARKLNYIPNPYASSLRRRKSKTIAVVLPEIANSFFSLAIDGIEAVAVEKGYHVLIYLTHESLLKEEAILQDFQSGRVDGVLISLSGQTTGTGHIRDLYAKDMPIVFFDRVCEDVETTKVITDDFESAYKATQYLIGKNCKRVGFLGMSPGLSITIKRMEGYKKALSDHQYAFNSSDIILCPEDPEKSYTTIRNALERKDRFDGIIASIERLSITTYLVCRELQLSIPGDVKIVGFSNLSSAAILNPSLTTITQPAFEMGKAAASALFKALKRESAMPANECIIIPSTLMVRDSTG
ncbi:MAG: LacI family DNA-binding transcriptional regulator [Puia sp.]|nr:LacI family DNA-binding transcriptional regulator [Puia sp.]